MDFGLTIEQILLRLTALEAGVESIPRVPATELGVLVDEDIPVAGDTIPEIVDQTGVAGTSEDYRRTDCVPKLKLAGSPADTGTAGNATLQFCASSGGLQVRRAAYGATVARLADIAGGDGTGGLGLPLATVSGLNSNAGAGGALAVVVAAPVKLDANGVGLNIGNGLELSGADLQIKLNGGTLTLGASGLSVTNPAPSAETETPENIVPDGSGSAGDDSDYAKGNHKHGICVTGVTDWHVSGGASAGKIYSVYKPDPV